MYVKQKISNLFSTILNFFKHRLYISMNAFEGSNITQEQQPTFT